MEKYLKQSSRRKSYILCKIQTVCESVCVSIDTHKHPDSHTYTCTDIHMHRQMHTYTDKLICLGDEWDASRCLCIHKKEIIRYKKMRKSQERRENSFQRSSQIIINLIIIWYLFKPLNICNYIHICNIYLHKYKCR